MQRYNYGITYRHIQGNQAGIATHRVLLPYTLAYRGVAMSLGRSIAINGRVRGFTSFLYVQCELVGQQARVITTGGDRIHVITLYVFVTIPICRNGQIIIMVLLTSGTSKVLARNARLVYRQFKVTCGL